MKLQDLVEAAKISSKGIMLGGGIIAIEDTTVPTASVRIWGLRRMFDDQDLGEVSINQEGPLSIHSIMKDGDVYLARISLYRTGIKASKSFSAAPEDIVQRVFDWAQTALQQLRESLASDAIKARANRRKDEIASHGVKLVRLNKAGEEINHRHYTTNFRTKAEAIAHHNQLVQNNPSSNIAHNLHVTNDLGSFKMKLSGRHDK